MLEEDDYPPYPPNVVRMAREAQDDERASLGMLAWLIPTVVAACAAVGLMVAYGWF